jgi:hypothetical protein
MNEGMRVDDEDGVHRIIGDQEFRYSDAQGIEHSGN